MSTNKLTLGNFLVEAGHFENADAALRAVVAGDVLVDEVIAKSLNQKITEKSSVRVRKKGRYVSRGGDKLEGALVAFGLDVSGKKCLDIGSSTGGFSDCLLKHGVASVACVDVNYGQLAWSVRQDSRVQVFERTNIKDASAAELGAPFELIVIDVSFIGLAALAADIARFCDKGTELVALVKPQFESKRGESVGGVVIDADIRARTIDEVKEALTQVGFECQGVETSPIVGKKSGNIEYLLHAVMSKRDAPNCICMSKRDAPNCIS